MVETPREEAREAAPAAAEGRPMFNHLLASKPGRAGKSAAAATLSSVAFHVVLIGGLVWATMQVTQAEPPAEEEVIPLAMVEEAPEPPPPPPLPEPPKVAPAAAAPETPTPQPAQVVENPKGFQTLTPPKVVLPDIPPPSMAKAINEADFTGEGVEGGKAGGTPVAAGTRVVTAEDVGSAPTFTPYTVAPELKNRDDVSRALQRNYPPLLRDSGIGGKVLVWFFIDETGRVRKTQVKESSGHEALDQAALRVADVMRFSPALNRDQKVPVWVALPIVFQAG